MAFRHQRYMCLQQIDCFGNANERYLYEGDHVSGGQTVALSLSPFCQTVHNCDVVCIPKSVKIYGRLYAAGCVLLESLYSESRDSIMPSFVQILTIGIIDFDKFFYCEQLDIEYYSDHYCAYKVCKSGSYRVIKFSDLVFSWPQLTNFIGSDFFVTLSYVPELL